MAALLNLIHEVSLHSEKQFLAILLVLVYGVFLIYLKNRGYFNLMDEVWDAGDFLLVKNGKGSEKILIEDINSLKTGDYGKIAWIELKTHCSFGQRLTFVPLVGFDLPMLLGRRKNPVKELQNRI